jgi:hypothetical protein
MTRSPTVTFAKHYAGMVLVMFGGMFLLGGALLLVASGLGASPEELREDAPGLVLLGMGFSMTAPMVWWMHRRGHTWAANRAMAIAMILPTAATILLLATGAIADIGTLLMIEHIAMLPAMFAAMLPYRAEYAPRAVAPSQRSAPRRVADRRLSPDATSGIGPIRFNRPRPRGGRSR